MGREDAEGGASMLARFEPQGPFLLREPIEADIEALNSVAADPLRIVHACSDIGG